MGIASSHNRFRYKICVSSKRHDHNFPLTDCYFIELSDIVKASSKILENRLVRCLTPAYANFSCNIQLDEELIEYKNPSYEDIETHIKSISFGKLLDVFTHAMFTLEKISTTRGALDPCSEGAYVAFTKKQIDLLTECVADVSKLNVKNFTELSLVLKDVVEVYREENAPFEEGIKVKDN